jgi:hypothetical protein
MLRSRRRSLHNGFEILERARDRAASVLTGSRGLTGVELAGVGL